MIVSVVLCEGAHDIAFISKILRANGCKEYKAQIKKYPYPIREQIQNNYAKDSIGEKIIGNGPDSPYIPKAVYTDGEKLILFHNMNGDSDTGSRYSLIEQYRKNSIALEVRGNPDNITAFEFYLFYDADHLGIAGRLDWIRDAFKDNCNLDVGSPGQASWSYISDGMTTESILGTYVFHDPCDTEGKGTLEDHLLFLMCRENGELFGKAGDFLAVNSLGAERVREYDPNLDQYVGGKKYKSKKSQISVAGQLQFSGMNNSVIILKSDFIKKETILQDDECIKIANLVLSQKSKDPNGEADI